MPKAALKCVLKIDILGVAWDATVNVIKKRTRCPGFKTRVKLFAFLISLTPFGKVSIQLSNLHRRTIKFYTTKYLRNNGIRYSNKVN